VHHARGQQPFDRIRKAQVGRGDAAVGRVSVATSDRIRKAQVGIGDAAGGSVARLGGGGVLHGGGRGGSQRRGAETGGAGRWERSTTNRFFNSSGANVCNLDPESGV
jgi:hypothetical protein